jgi:hypothetical protein
MTDQNIKKGAVTSVLPESVAKAYEAPTLSKVSSTVKTDGPEFMPALLPDGSAEVKANLPNKQPYLLNYRNTVKIDCGFRMDLQPGYVANFRPLPELAEKGLLLQPWPTDDGRVVVLATNVGREIVQFEHGKPFGTVQVSRAFGLEWVVG